MDTSYAKADSYDTPDSNPWGTGGNPKGGVSPVGGSKTEGGFYDTRDDMVGGTDTQWNYQGTDVDQQSGANWLSAGDSAEVWNSASGLNGYQSTNGIGDAATFSEPLSQESLGARGPNPDSSYGH